MKKMYLLRCVVVAVGLMTNISVWAHDGDHTYANGICTIEGCTDPYEAPDQDSEGWFRTLNIAKEGAWLNETVMLDAPKVALAAEVLSERATILAVPKAAMKNIISIYPGLWQNITTHVITQLENFQKLWAQS